MLDLLAKTWKLSPVNAIRKALQLGFAVPPGVPIEDLLEEHLQKFTYVREKHQAFWKQCIADFFTAGSAELRKFQRYLGMTDSPSNLVGQSDWFLVGASTKVAADAFLNPSRNREEVKRLAELTGRKDLRHGSEIFRGRDWGDVLVIPFYDLPGRLAGFTFVGRQMRYPEDFVHKSLWHRNVSYESSITMLPSVYSQEHPQFGNAVFVVDDVLTALRLQLRRMKTSSIPLPVVATYLNDKEVTSPFLSWMAPEALIYWSLRGDPRMIGRAQAVGARVSTYQVTEAEMSINIRSYEPLELLSFVKQRSVTWEEAVERVVATQTTDAIEETFLTINLPGPTLRQFIDTRADPLRKRLQTIYRKRPDTKSVNVGSLVVFEQRGCWYISRPSGTCRISDAIVRIETVLQTAKNKQYYSGIIRFNDEDIPFTAPAEPIDENLFTWARHFLLSQGKGMMQFVRGYGPQGAAIAVAFHKPRTIRGSDVVGWDTERRQFNLPKYAITWQGEVLSEGAPCFEDELAPALKLELPEPLDPKIVAQLSEASEETSIFWAMAACVASNVTAPAMFNTTFGTALCGQGAISVGAAAALLLGCPETQMPSIQTPHRTRVVSRKAKHRWPTLFHSAFSNVNFSAIDTWLTKPQARQAILTTSYYTAQVLATRGTWNVIHCPSKLGTLHGIDRSARMVMPAYLQHLCLRRLEVNYEHTNPVLVTLDDLAYWFKDACGGNPATVLNAKKVLTAAGTLPVGRAFLDMVFELRQDKKLVIAPVDVVCYTRERPCIVQVPDKNLIWLPQDAICAAIYERATLYPTRDAITQSFQDEGCLFQVGDYQSTKGWYLDREWFNQRCEEWFSRSNIPCPLQL